MALDNGLIVISILIICVLFWTGFVDGSYFDEPQIVSQYETIIEANDNHSVFCQGNRPLKWSVPEVEEAKNSWTTFTTVSEKPLNTHFQYGLRLYITNMSYPFVGFYNCHFEDRDKEDDGSAKIYLFVNDNSHFSVLDVDYILMDPVTQFEEAIIPCRPTSPDVQVQLQLNSGEMVDVDIVSMEYDTAYHFDPHYGFITNDTREKNKDALLICQYVRDGHTEVQIVSMVVENKYSLFVFAYPCADIISETVCRCLGNLFSIFGMPSYIHSDQGTSFMSSEIKSYLHSRGIATSRTTPYNPQENGQTERYDGIIWKTIMLATRTKGLKTLHWEIVLEDALHSVRSLLCTSTCCIPHERMFTHQRKSANGIALPSWLTTPVLMKKHVQLLEANPQYALVEDAEYNPKTGFSIFVYDLSQQDVYRCIFLRGSEQSDIYLHLIINPLPVSHLAMPDLREESDGHTEVGDTLILRCAIYSANRVKFNWTTPTGPMDMNRMSTNQLKDDNNKVWQDLYVNKTTLKDSGRYSCKVSDYQGHEKDVNLTVKIYDIGENYINISEPNDVYYSLAFAGKDSIQWVVDVRGHPKPTIKWIDNKNNTIPDTDGVKYEVSFNNKTNKAMLKIKNIVINDFGNYTLVGNNGKSVQKLNFFLNVTDKPTVHLETKPFHLIGTSGTVRCIAAAYPEPEFRWEYKACQTDECQYVKIDGNLIEKDGLLFTSEVEIVANQSGYVRCQATNFNGSEEAVTGFYVSDVKDGFDIFGFDETVVIDKQRQKATFAKGEDISVICGASSHNYSQIVWFFNNKILEDDERHSIRPSYTQFSNRSNLKILSASSLDDGRYACRVEYDGNFVFKNISFIITNPVPPNINDTNMRGGIKEMDFPDKLILTCKVYGIPKPEITWYKNSAPFYPVAHRIFLSENKDKLTFNRTDPKDEGTYKCLAKNKIGVVSRQTSVKFKNLPRSQTWLILIIIFLSVLFIAALIFIIIKIRREKHLQKELKLLGLANFEKGAVENINPDLGIDDQAELLPYERKWEFPIEQLKLGKQLGSGAFGVVMKGVAKNIADNEDYTTVAVKMVKKNADNTYIRALASELKIMVHLGKHLNVVNLLGACTKNVAKRELLVIVEYCRFGNLQNYLVRHRANFVNQVDPKSGKIDYTIGEEYLDRTYSVSSNKSKQAVMPPPNSMGDYRANSDNLNSTNTEMTTLPQGEDGVVLSNNSIQPDWRSNYKGDYKGQVKPISTKDLMAWSFQVARGMDYLASRKVLHGDLAARNILLTDNDVVKICDFGLAKSMYKNDNYKKRGNCPLPIKWMAIESISDRIFSTQSDVWSFGIVLWEFFSLAKIPYPGMAADERLYQKLVDGYRMESPDYAPKEIYQMMTDCWATNPLARPSFEKLTEKLGNLLEDTLRQHYVDLNDPYLVMNTKCIGENQSDYLAMVSPPTFEAQASPQYENELIISEPFSEPGYMSMKPNTIFSPRVTDGDVFDFNTNHRKRSNSQDAKGTELLPILHSNTESDTETPAQSPNSVSNPTYHHIPITKTEGDIVRSADNYVNMPQNKNMGKEKNNPFTNGSNAKEESQYVNSNSRDWESVIV